MTQRQSSDAATIARADELLALHQRAIWTRTDRLFAGLLLFDWIALILLALWLSPRGWNGAISYIHPHVWAALSFGLVISFPIALAFLRPAEPLTRHVIAISQALFSALLIHTGGGRIEMHFYIFGALAFLAFYRDWHVLISYSIIVALDHVLGTFYIPEAVYGALSVSGWRWVEHAWWIIFEDVFLILSCLQGVREMRGIAERQALLEQSYRSVEQKVDERTRQLKEAQDKLVGVARAAGMAEIATSVLHNVGNVLNSVNVSVSVASSKVQELPIEDLTRAVRMMTDNRQNLGTFIEKDERGSRIPDFLAAVTDIMGDEKQLLLAEMASLTKNIEHIKQIVGVQQSHAKGGPAIGEVNLPGAIDDAVQISGITAEQHQIQLERDLCPAGVLLTDKHMLLQILINLLSNAKHAVLQNDPGKRRLGIRTSIATRDNADWLVLQVIDNGVGIDPAHLTRIFNHGFTTKKDGHGFGLHSSANSARQLGGSLNAHSGGPGTGATFTLELPLTKESVLA